jgi:hypothetical protein
MSQIIVFVLICVLAEKARVIAARYEGRANMDRVTSLPIQDFDGMVAEIWQTLFEPSLPRGG